MIALLYSNLTANSSPRSIRSLILTRLQASNGKVPGRILAQGVDFRFQRQVLKSSLVDAPHRERTEHINISSEQDSQAFSGVSPARSLHRVARLPPWVSLRGAPPSQGQQSPCSSLAVRVACAGGVAASAGRPPSAEGAVRRISAAQRRAARQRASLVVRERGRRRDGVQSHGQLSAPVQAVLAADKRRLISLGLLGLRKHTTLSLDQKSLG